MRVVGGVLPSFHSEQGDLAFDQCLNRDVFGEALRGWAVKSRRAVFLQQGLCLLVFVRAGVGSERVFIAAAFDLPDDLLNRVVEMRFGRPAILRANAPLVRRGANRAILAMSPRLHSGVPVIVLCGNAKSRHKRISAGVG